MSATWRDPLAEAQAQLDPGERLIWAGRPRPRQAGRRALPLLLLGLIFAGIAWSWTAQAWAAKPVLAVVGLAFVAMGLVVATSPWWRTGRESAVVYAVSDRRLLIIEGSGGRRVRSFGPEAIGNIERREHRDGSGDVIFGRELIDGLPPGRAERISSGAAQPFRRRRQGFLRIADAQRVEAAVRELQRSGRGAG